MKKTKNKNRDAQKKTDLYKKVVASSVESNENTNPAGLLLD